VHDVAGHGIEEPVHEAPVLHHPLWIGKLRGSGGGLNVGKKTDGWRVGWGGEGCRRGGGRAMGGSGGSRILIMGVRTKTI